MLDSSFILNFTSCSTASLNVKVFSLLVCKRLQVNFLVRLYDYTSFLFSEISGRLITFRLNVAVVLIVVWVGCVVSCPFDLEFSEFICKFATSFLWGFNLILLFNIYFPSVNQLFFALPVRLGIFLAIRNKDLICDLSCLLDWMTQVLIFIELLANLTKQVTRHFTFSSLLARHLHLNFLVHFHSEFERSSLVKSVRMHINLATVAHNQSFDYC
jgi:hypothetical protein